MTTEGPSVDNPLEPSPPLRLCLKDGMARVTLPKNFEDELAKGGLGEFLSEWMSRLNPLGSNFYASMSYDPRDRITIILLVGLGVSLLWTGREIWTLRQKDEKSKMT